MTRGIFGLEPISFVQIRHKRKSILQLFHCGWIINDEFNYASTYRTPGGTIIMGTLNGITLFNPKDIIGNVPLPPVQLIRMQKYNGRTGKLSTIDKVADLGHQLKYHL
jgi:hypothetical protein